MQLQHACVYLYRACLTKGERQAALVFKCIELGLGRM